MERKPIGWKIKNAEHRAQLILVFALFVSCLVMFHEYLFGNDLMVFNDVGNDTWQQYIQQYATVINHLLEGNFTVWDFNNGLGTNMLSMNLFDPSLMILYFLGLLFGTQKMLYFISWMQVVRVLLAGLAFYHFMSQFSYRISVKTAVSFAWGLNGYLLVWGQHYQFGVITIYLPLMLMFCEKYLRKEKGRRGFPVMVALSCMYSVYLSYMSLIAVGFYMIFRVWMMDLAGMKERLKRFFGGCGQIILGIGMSCAVFLPSVATMVGVSGRISASDQGIIAWLKEYLTPFSQSYYESVIMRLFSSNLQESYQLSDGRYEAFRNYYEDPVFYISNILLILAIQAMCVLWRTRLKARVKLAVYAAAALIGFTVLFPLGGCVFNGFMYASHRHTFVFLPFFLLAGAWMWEYLLDGGIPSFLGLLVTAFLAERVFHLGYAQTLFTSYRKNILVLAGTSALTILIVGIYPFMRKIKKIRWNQIAIAVLTAAMVINAVSEGYTSYNERIVLHKEDTALEDVEEVQAAYEAEFYSGDQERFVLSWAMEVQDYFREMYSEDIQAALNYLEELDDTFYRVEKDFSSGTIAMDALVQEYYGVSTYNSTLNGNLKEFIATCYPDLFGADKAHVQFWEEADDNQLAAYFGVKYLLSKNPDLDETKYRLLQQFGDIYVYENVLEANTAKFYDIAISEESFKDLYSSWCREEFLGEVLAIEGGAEVGSLTELRELKSATEAKETDTKISGTETSAAEASDTAFNESFVTLDSLEKHSKVTGTVHAATDGYIMFMIPYEQGWSLTVDGAKTEIMRGDLGFISCKVAEGDHELVLSFHTPMVMQGILVAVIFWCLYAVMLYADKKRRKAVQKI